MDDDQFRMLLEYLDYSWPGYRKVRKGVKKRIRRHMQHIYCRDISAYLKILDRQPVRRQECELLMTVSISRFLRNNVLTYCRQEARKKAVISVLNCLAPGGLLIIGCHETLPFKTDRLISIDSLPYVFRRI